MIATGRLSGLKYLDRDAFRRWAVAAISTAAVAFAGIVAANLVLNPERTAAIVALSFTVLSCLVAIPLAARGRVEAAVMLTIAGIWVALLTTVAVEGPKVTALIPLPVLVVATGIILGMVGALVTTGLTTVALTAAIWASHVYSGVPSQGAGWEAYIVIVVVFTMLVGTGLIHVGLMAFGRVTTEARATARRLDDLIRFAPDGIVVVDEAGTVQSANPAAVEILSCDEQALVGECLPELLATRAAEGQARVAGSILDHGRVTPLELLSPDRESTWVQIQASRLPAAPEGGGLQVILRDITLRRQAEEGERILRVQLEQARRMEAVGRLAGGVAHGFNNLLTAVGASAELIAEETHGEPRELARDIISAQKKGMTLSHQLLSFARKEFVQPRPVPLADGLRGMGELLVHFVTGGTELRFEIPDTPVRVVADGGQLEQVVISLVSNARDALRGTGAITVGLSEPGDARSWLGHALDGVREGFVEIWVADDGPGMEPDVLARIFDPFFTTKPPGPSSGLGLSSVHGIVTQNGGSVSVKSWPGSGTVARVFWPIEGAARAEG